MIAGRMSTLRPEGKAVTISRTVKSPFTPPKDNENSTDIKPPLVTRAGSASLWLTLDIIMWFGAIVLAQMLQEESDLRVVSWTTTATLALAVALMQATVGTLIGVYRGRFLTGSARQAQALVVTLVVAFGFVAATQVTFAQPGNIPPTTLAIALPFATVGSLTTRYLWRLATHSHARLGDVERTINHKARQAGANGGTSRWGRDGSRRRTESATKAALVGDQSPTRRHPSKEFSTLAVSDMIGRRPINTDISAITGYLRDKRVLVTGAGGSIGLELCRQIHLCQPAELVMLDRDETGLQSAELAIYGQGLLVDTNVVLADIRDSGALRTIFEDQRPDVVFHAAALKHLPILERYPEEAWKTNVIGTLNVLEAAQNSGVKKLVNISTDKAANPRSALGHSKRLAERLTTWMSRQIREDYVSVRFGNVLGSRGSMLPVFAQMIENGGPITVTHPEATRYFMTISEACQLVMQAGSIGRGGEVMVLDMGEPVRILDIAQRLIEVSGKTVGIVFTGLRKGEKLHEVRLADGEPDHRPMHRLISHASVPPLSPNRLELSHWLAAWQASQDPQKTTHRAPVDAMGGNL